MGAASMREHGRSAREVIGLWAACALLVTIAVVVALRSSRERSGARLAAARLRSGRGHRVARRHAHAGGLRTRRSGGRPQHGRGFRPLLRALPRVTWRHGGAVAVENRSLQWRPNRNALVRPGLWRKHAAIGDAESSPGEDAAMLRKSVLAVLLVSILAVASGAPRAPTTPRCPKTSRRTRSSPMSSRRSRITFRSRTRSSGSGCASRRRTSMWARAISRSAVAARCSPAKPMRSSTRSARSPRRRYLTPPARSCTSIRPASPSSIPSTITGTSPRWRSSTSAPTRMIGPPRSPGV